MEEADKILRFLIKEQLNYIFRETDTAKVYPTLRQLRSILRNNIIVPLKRKIHAAYIIGSEAKGTAKTTSDLDIAIIIDPVRGKTALQLTEIYHSKFYNENFTPKWNGRKIDVQFFYPGDSDLESYSKIELK
jgi:predicted nucleotidyltransferase